MPNTEVAVHRRFSPSTFEERRNFAIFLSDSRLIPVAYQRKPADILVAMEYGDSLGIPMVQAMATINVIEGKPSASAALISALVRRSGHQLRVGFDSATMTATATIRRSDDPDWEYKAVWDLQRAARAGLVKVVDGKPVARSQNGKVLPWEAYPEALLKARAVSEVARDACQEALMGIQHTAEELGAVVDEYGTVVEDPQASRNARPVEATSVTTVEAEAAEPLPDNFTEVVADAEERRDRNTLRAAYTQAVKSRNADAIQLAIDAGTRVAHWLADHPGAAVADAEPTSVEAAPAEAAEVAE